MEREETLRTSSALSALETMVLLLIFSMHLVGPFVLNHRVCLFDFASAQEAVRGG